MKRVDKLQRDTIKIENVSPAPKIIIANSKDSYAKTADADGFGFTTDWADAASQADALFLLVPDQVPCSSMLPLANSG